MQAVLGGVGMGEATGEVAALIARARDRDQQAFSEIYRQTVVPVYRYLSARVATVEEAEDLTQEVFLAALAGVAALRAEDETSLLAWLFQIARHKHADHLRRRYRRPMAPLDDAAEVADSRPGPDERAESTEETASLRTALDDLTSDQREVVICKYVLGYGNEQTAQIVGKKPNAVNQLHHRALRNLRRMLGPTEARG